MALFSLAIPQAIVIIICWGLSLPLLAQTLKVKDENLNRCLQEIASDHQWTSALQFSGIVCHGKDIQTLQGLEKFVNIKQLSLYNNELTSIDINLRAFVHLERLNLARNQLNEFSISQMSSLKSLYIFSNRLKQLNLKQLDHLQKLKANNNKLEKFHYEHTPNLTKIYIFNNQLENINIYDLPALQYMDCRENPMPDALYDEMDRMESVTFLHDGNAEDW